MFFLALLIITAAAVAGLAVKFAFDYKNKKFSRAGESPRVTWPEYAIGMIIIAAVVTPLVLYVGWTIAKSDNLTFYEYLNGWELEAVKVETQCSKNGPCRYEYDCEPYVVLVTYPCNCGKDGCSTCTRLETRYHSCPYVDKETTYVVKTTLGEYVIGEHRFPESPENNRWKGTRDYKKDIPDYVVARAGVGEPLFWKQAKERTDSGNPGPATKRRHYDNYILASDKTILNQYSSAVEDYRAKGLLPKLEIGVYDFYIADKAHFVGFKPADAKEWQKKISYLNAGLGAEFQGDARFVIVKNEYASGNPDAYVFALKAYWQDTRFFGKDIISKNSVVFVVGTEDGLTVSWARAFTGMPLGNERLISAARDNLVGAKLAPEILIGEIRGEFDGQKRNAVKTVNGKGAIEKIAWGLGDKTTKFVRVKMASFKYLEREIQLSARQKIFIGFLAFAASVGIWIFALSFDDSHLLNGLRNKITTNKRRK